VVEVNLQSQRFELSGEGSISFLTADGFTITIEGTIEYALAAEQVALLTHKVGDMDDVLKKIILPRARGFSRIEGSKHPAKNFITGDTRQQFQNNLEEHLRKMCVDWGIGIKSVLIRNIAPPEEIASVIRDREVAVQTARKYDQQLEQARSKAELTRQEMLALQNKEKVESDTVRIRAVIKAQQEQAVRVTAANRELEVAKLERDAAVAQAAAIVRRAEADRDVVRMRNEADAAVIAGKVAAFGDGMNVARYALYERLGPRIKSVLSADGQGGLGEIFTPYLPPRKEVPR
jgi:regulator of protease activity HflC (stomatin/prohibitin superfamily)